jgi:hypothetical protein
VFAAGALLLTGSVSAQMNAVVKVSNVIEGGVGGVSAARCGNTVVVGFADAEPTRPNSYDGVAVSKDGGVSFSDRGTLPVPPVNPEGGPSILGSNSEPNGTSNPSVACANSNVFYYASIYSLPGDNCSNGSGACTAISISTSTNGGTTWGLPVVASNLQGSDVFDFVSPSMAVDPTNAMRLYVAYIEVDNDGFFGPPDCFGSVFSLVIVHSLDGGKTWSAPLREDRACPASGADPELTGTLVSPNIAVSPGGKVYVAYEFFSTFAFFGGSAPNEIRFTRSLNDGATFSTPITVSKDAISNALPELAVDRTVSTHRGEIYLTWSGTPTGTYTDVLVSDSVNFGLSFSFPRPISPAPTAGRGRFQTNPVLAVDNDGQIEACFYDTPSDQPISGSVYSYNCATSFTHAATWAVHRLASSAPVGYDAATGDFLLHNDGFFTAFELQTSTGQRHVVGLKSDNP